MNDKIENQIEDLAAGFFAWELEQLKRLGSRLKNVQTMETTPEETHATARKDMRRARVEFAALLAYTAIEIRKIYKDLLSDLHKQNERLFTYRGILTPDLEKIADIDGSAAIAVNAITDAVKTSALCVVDDAGKVVKWKDEYDRALQGAVDKIQSGCNFHSAVRDTVREIGGSGLRVDYGGVTRRLDTVVRQTVLYYGKQAGMAYQDRVWNIVGADGVEIDYHSSPRPSHEFMQGQQYHIGGEIVIDGKLYKDATEALARLEDYNCYHYKTPIICGVSAPRYDDAELSRLKAEDAKEYTVDGKTQTRYGWTQDLRKLESAIRTQKTTREMARAAGEKELAKGCTDRIMSIKHKYYKICEQTGIQPTLERAKIVRKPID